MTRMRFSGVGTQPPMLRLAATIPLLVSAVLAALPTSVGASVDVAKVALGAHVTSYSSIWPGGSADDVIGGTASCYVPYCETGSFIFNLGDLDQWFIISLAQGYALHEISSTQVGGTSDREVWDSFEIQTRNGSGPWASWGILPGDWNIPASVTFTMDPPVMATEIRCRYGRYSPDWGGGSRVYEIFALADVPTTISGVVSGGIWQRPHEQAPSVRTIPGVQVQAWRGTTDWSPVVWAGLDGTYSLSAALRSTDVVRATARNEWLEIGEYGGGNPTMERQVLAGGSPLDLEWPTTGSYAGDGLNAYFIAEDFGRTFWKDHMARGPAPGNYSIGVKVPGLSGVSGAGTASIAPGFVAQSTFAPGMAKYRDAVCHEFVHGMIVQQLGHFLSERLKADGKYEVDSSSEAKGLDEGLADYFTYAYTGQADFGAGIFGNNRPLDQPVFPNQYPWCNGYADGQKGYQAARAISGALYDLRQALGVGQPGSPGKQGFDRWLFDAVFAMRDLAVPERTAYFLRHQLETTPLTSATEQADRVAAAFDRHNIKAQPENTSWCGVTTNVVAASRVVSGGVQTVGLSWSPVPLALFYRVFLVYGGSLGGLGPGTLVGDNLASTSFEYTDPDTTSQVVLTVVPVDASGFEGNPSVPINTALLSVGDAPHSAPMLQLTAGPNPFRAGLMIRGSLAPGARGSVTVLDLSGRLVRVLVAGALVPTGAILTQWDGRDAVGHRVPAGLYFVRLTDEVSVLLKKVALLP